MKNLDTGLNGEFIVSSRKLLLLLFFASASTYSVVSFEIFNHGQCFTIFTSGWCELYTVSISLNKLEIGSFSFICLAQTMTSSLLQNSNLMFVSKEASNRDTSLKTQLLLSTENEKKAEIDKIWEKVGCFGDQTTDFTITKANFPENTLVYAN